MCVAFFTVTFALVSYGCYSITMNMAASNSTVYSCGSEARVQSPSHWLGEDTHRLLLPEAPGDICVLALQLLEAACCLGPWLPPHTTPTSLSIPMSPTSCSVRQSPSGFLIRRPVSTFTAPTPIIQGKLYIFKTIAFAKVLPHVK